MRVARRYCRSSSAPPKICEKYLQFPQSYSVHSITTVKTWQTPFIPKRFFRFFKWRMLPHVPQGRLIRSLLHRETLFCRLATQSTIPKPKPIKHKTIVIHRHPSSSSPAPITPNIQNSKVIDSHQPGQTTIVGRSRWVKKEPTCLQD